MALMTSFHNGTLSLDLQDMVINNWQKQLWNLDICYTVWALCWTHELPWVDSEKLKANRPGLLLSDWLSNLPWWCFPSPIFVLRTECLCMFLSGATSNHPQFLVAARVCIRPVRMTVGVLLLSLCISQRSRSRVWTNRKLISFFFLFNYLSLFLPFFSFLLLLFTMPKFIKIEFVGAPIDNIGVGG